MEQEKQNENSIHSDFITLKDAATRSGYTPEHLNYCARSGKLQATKLGRNWYTTERSLNTFLGTENTSVGDISKEERDRVSQESLISKRPLSAIFLSCARKTALIAITAIAPLAFFFGVTLLQNGENSERIAQAPSFDISRGVVLGEETAVATALASSENFQVRQVILGGEGTLTLDPSEFLPLTIMSVRSESLPTKGDDEGSKLLLSWKTNKIALSEVHYGKRDGSDAKVRSEDSYGLDHSMILEDLGRATGYVYTISAKDRYGNSVESDRFVAFTGSSASSVFQLLTKATGDVFGWALR